MSVLCSVHKKGDAMVCQNYRGISLLNTCYKVVSNIILNRIKRDALSPTLFNIALESVVREVLEDGTGLRIGEGHKITLAAYADDIIILGETEEDLKRLAEKLISKE
jgi:hypothetical protein